MNIIGKIKLSFINEKGIELIKDTLLTALKVVENPRDTRKIDISYIATPFYRLEIVSKDYIDAEGILSDVIDIVETKAGQNEGQFEFIRD